MDSGSKGRTRSSADWNAAMTATRETLGSQDDIFRGKDLVTNDQRLLRLPTIEAQLAAWIRGYEQGMVSRCLTLKRTGFSLYVRCSLRDIEGTELVTLDIAKISSPPKYRGRGWFRSLRQIAEALNPWHATYYEMVHNERLATHLKSAGLASDIARCYYKIHKITDRRS